MPPTLFSFKWLLALGLGLLLLPPLAGQLQVSVAVNPPYSVYLEDYLRLANNSVIVVTNPSAQSRQFKLIPTLSSDDGLQIGINPAFQPASPIFIGPNQTLTLTGNQLSAYNRNFTERDLLSSGVNRRQLILDGVLPEGNYQLCLEAYDYQNNSLLSASNCSNFWLSHYDPPVLIYPDFDEAIPETTPQLLTFSWTATGNPAYTRYEFQLVDMDQNQLFNPNDAFGNLGVQLHFKQDFIPTNNLVYTLANPPLVPGHTYAVRVIAKDPTQTIAFKNNGIGPVSTFRYTPKPGQGFASFGNQPAFSHSPDTSVVVGKIRNINFQNNGPNDQANNLPPTPEDCLAACSLPPVQGAEASPLSGNDISAGYFKISKVQVNGNSGTGEVYVDFLKVHLKVKWSNIKVNPEGKLKTGKIYAELSPGSVISPSLAQDPQADLSTLYPELLNLGNEVAAPGKRVSQLTGNEPPTALPLALDKQGLDLIIAGMVFEAQQAQVNLIAGLDIPESTLGDRLGMSRAGIVIQPNGFCGNAPLKLFLEENVQFKLSNQAHPVELAFPSGEDQVFLTFDCQGPKELKLKGEFIFPPEKLLAVNAEGQEMPGTKVRIPFAYTAQENFQDWILENLQTVPAHFSFPATKGFVFQAQNLVYDHHGSQNVPDLVFHPNHPHHPSQGLPNSKLWRGFYLKDFSLKFPQGFQKNGGAVLVSGQDVMLDRSGFWGVASLQDIITPQDNGSLGGWQFSIAELLLNFEASSLSQGYFTGGIELPISSLALDYQVPLTGGEDYDFQIELGEAYPLDMWLATLDLASNSSVSIAKVNNSFVPKAHLNGSISIAWDKQSTAALPNDLKPAVGQFNLPELAFQDFTIESVNGQPKIGGITLGLDDPDQDQGKLLNMPLTLDSFYLQNEAPGQGSLGMKLRLNFGGGDNGLSGETDLVLDAALSDKKFRYAGVQLNSVAIDVQTSMAILKGQIDLFQDNLEYGNGFRGFIYAKILPLGAEVNVTLQVGKTLGSNGYKYWMFDAGYRANVGIPMGAVALYGLGGGGYFNMQREEVELSLDELEHIDQNSFDPSPGDASNGIKFTPQPGGFGFSASAVIGLAGSAAAFNADLKFGMDFYDGGAVDKIYFTGQGFLMQNMSSRDGDAALQGSCNIEVVMAKPNDPSRPRFTVDVAILVHVASIAEVQATANMYFSPEDWYIYFGKWSQDVVYDDRIKLAVDLPLIDADLVLSAYFMMGSEMPANLPPLPTEIQDFFGNPKVAQNVSNKSSKPQPTANMGFAFGFMVDFDVSLEVAIIYADIDFILGADALLANVQGADCNGKSNFGFNNWYAKGQGYAYVNIEAGLVLDVWFWQGKAALAQITAGAVLQFQGPNPTWIAGQLKIQGSILGGLIRVNTSIYAEVGEKCGDEFGSPFDDIPIVSYTGPEDKDQEVHVFRDPEIVFNYPNEPFVLEAVTENGEVEMRAFSYVLHKHEYRYKDAQNQSKVIATKAPQYSEDGYSCFLSPHSPLPELSAIDYRIEARGYEHQMNGNYILASKSPACPMQVTEGTFYTDSLPDAIVIEDVVSSVPALSQRYFLKGSYPQGTIAMSNAECSHLFRSYSLSDANEEFIYKARFKELRSNATQETDCSCADQTVQFSVPPDLKNNRIYQLEIVRIGQPKQNKTAESKNVEAYKTIGGTAQEPTEKMSLKLPSEQVPPGNAFSKIKVQPPQVNPKPGLNLSLQNLNPPPKPKPFQNLQSQGLPENPGQKLNLNLQTSPPQKTISLDIYDRRLTGQVQQVKVTEKVLFSYHFKTSKYNTLNEKAAAMKPAGYQVKSYSIPGIHTIGLENASDEVNIPVLFLEASEGFDQYDLYGIWYAEPEEFGGNISKFIPPILGFKKTNALSHFDAYYQTAYDASQSALFFNQDAEDFRFANELWDPYNYDAPLTYQSPDLPEAYQDLRQFIQYPDWQKWYFEKVDWSPHRFNGGNKGNRFGYSLETKTYRLPDHSEHLGNGLPYDYLPIEAYVQALHGYIDFGGRNMLAVQGKLNAGEIEAEEALNNQLPANNLLNNQVGKSYLAMLDYSEYLTKRDHLYLANQILYALRDEMCMNCGNDPGKVPPGGVVDFLYVDPDLKGEADFNNWVLSQPYTFEFIPMRSFLLNHKPYKPRKKGEFVYFGLGNSEYAFKIDQQLNASEWKYSLPILPF